MIGFRHGGYQRTRQGQHISRTRRIRGAGQHHRRLLHRQVQTAVRRRYSAILQSFQLNVRPDIIFLIQHSHWNGQPRQGRFHLFDQMLVQHSVRSFHQRTGAQDAIVSIIPQLPAAEK